MSDKHFGAFMTQCKHTNTKEKLVVFATKSRCGHLQGFRKSLCCADCGIIIDKKRKV